MFKFILLALSLLTSLLFSIPSIANECPTISPSQRTVLLEAYFRGFEYDLGYTMMAIAWGESTAGKYKINPESQDYGVMHNNIKTAKVRTGTKGYYATRALMTRLVMDDGLSMDLALEELLYWKGAVKGWRNMVSAYNNGWAYGKGNVFLTKVSENVRMFQRCGV